jgi:hypothetical protein
MHKVYTPDITIAVENVVVFVLRLAAFAGQMGATKDQGGVGHCRTSQAFASCANSRTMILAR